MGDLITDEVLDAFAVSGTPADVAAGVLRRFGDVIDRISLYTPEPPGRAALSAVTDALRAQRT